MLFLTLPQSQRGRMTTTCAQFSPVSFVVFRHAGLQGALRITFPTIALDIFCVVVRATPPAVLSGAFRGISLAL
ncbi:hypothetical protein GOODEAATRI_029399, partial [Goodea atripinnis]